MTSDLVASTSLDGKTALVTGSSRGIGRATARLLARHGATVGLHGRDREALAEVADEIDRTGGSCTVIAADLTAPEAAEDLIRKAESELGGIDILVSNAGGSPTRPQPVEEMSEDDFRAAVELNLVATFRLVKAALPGMKTRGSGSIVTISSAAARRPSAHSPIAYAAAKSAVEVFTKDVALQAGPSGVRANCVAPETILTDANRELIPADLQEKMAGQHPLQRLGTVDDVAEAVLFLAGERSAWISGVVLDVAGGSVV